MISRQFRSESRPLAARCRHRAAWLVAVFTLALVAGCGGEREVAIDLPAQETVAERAPLAAVVDTVDGPARTLDEAPFEFAWDLQLEAPVHTSWMSPNLRDLLFVQLETGEIQAIDVFSGETRWVTRVLPKLIQHKPYVHRIEYTDPNTGATLVDLRLYVITGDELHAYDCAYGELIWRHYCANPGPFGFQPSSGPFAMGALSTLRVYCGDWEGRLQVVGYHQAYARPYGVWQWNLRAVPTAQPVGRDDRAYVGDHAGVMSCFGLERELRWRFVTTAPIRGSGYIMRDNLYFGSDDNILYAVDRHNGNERGRVYVGAPIRSQPFSFQTEPTDLYVFSSGGPEQAGLRNVHVREETVTLEDTQMADTGESRRIHVVRMEEEWFLPGFSRVVGSSPGRLYLTRPNSSVVVAVDRSSGEIDWHLDLAAEREGTITAITSYIDPTDVVRALVTFDDRGYAVAYRLFGSEMAVR